MKKLLLAIAPVTAIVLFSLGCQREKTVPVSSAGSNLKTMSSDVCTPENSDNPEDAIGLEHNRRLNGILSSPYLYGHSYAQIAYAARMWCEANDITPDEADMSISVMTTVDEDYPNNFENVIASLDMSDDAKGYLNYLRSFGEDYPDDIDFCTYKELLLSQEAEIVASTSLSESEKTMLLRGYSIARYSASNMLPTNENVPVGRSISLWEVALYDVYGYFVGYELGQDNGLPLDQCAQMGLTRAAQASSCRCLY